MLANVELSFHDVSAQREITADLEEKKRGRNHLMKVKIRNVERLQNSAAVQRNFKPVFEVFDSRRILERLLEDMNEMKTSSHF